jgi:hypothetical protein
MIENFVKPLFSGDRSDSRPIRFQPQIASSGETTEIAFDGRYRQKRLLVTSTRDVRVRSTVFRRRFDGGGSSCRQQQSRASADHPHREGLRRGTLSWPDGGPAVNQPTRRETMAKRKKAAKKKGKKKRR